MARRPPTYLLVLGEREGIWWVLTQRRMAFEAHRAAQAGRQLELGTGLLLYATRGAFHNPTRDRGQVIGEATVVSPLQALDEPVVIAGREFTVACDLDITTIAARSEGVELATLVEQLETFPVKHAWSARLRQPLVALAARTLTSCGAAYAARRLGPIATRRPGPSGRHRARSR